MKYVTFKSINVKETKETVSTIKAGKNNKTMRDRKGAGLGNVLL